MAITDCQFFDNKAVPDDADGYGAGLYVYGAAVTVSDSVFSGNHVGGERAEGGAIFLYDASSSTTVTGCTITNNLAEANGGGIASEAGPITITDTTITDNTAGLTGGGIYSDAGVVTLAASVSITGNKAQDGGESGGGATLKPVAPSTGTGPPSPAIRQTSVSVQLATSNLPARGARRRGFPSAACMPIPDAGRTWR